MFPTIDLLTDDGRFRQAWRGLVRRIQTTIEHIRGTDVAAAGLTRGTVVAMGAGNRQIVAADADAAATSRGIGVLEDVIGAGGLSGILATDNLAMVRFEPALAPVAGEAVYVSQTAGLARNAPPAAGWTYRMGVIFDASMYATTSMCVVLLKPCCAPYLIAN